MAQDGINDSRLQIQSLMLSDPTPNSFHLEQTAVAGNSGNYHPRLDAFNASLSLDGSENDVPYAYITLPAIHASKTTTIHVNQTVQITDLAAFNEYNAAILGSDSVKIRLKGRTKLHEMRFPTTTVDFDKVVTMKGQLHFLSPLLFSSRNLKKRREKKKVLTPQENQASTPSPASP